MVNMYANYKHVEKDERQTCWAMGDIRCNHIDGRCNGERFPYDDSWEKEVERLNEILE